MTALAAFFSDPRLVAYTDAQRAKLLRIVALVQQIGEGNRLQMRLVTWAKNLRVSLTRLPELLEAFASDGALRVEEGLVEVADWLLRLFDAPDANVQQPVAQTEASAMVQQALGSLESARPPSKQPEYTRQYMQERRATSAPTPARVTASEDLEETRKSEVAAWMETILPEEAETAKSSSASNMPSNNSNKASNKTSDEIGTADIVRNFEPFVRNDVRSDEAALAIAQLAEASSCIHEKAKAQALRLRAKPAPPKYAQYNRLHPSQEDIHHLLSEGYSCADVEEAIRRVQNTKDVLDGGGIGEKNWEKYLRHKLGDMQPQPQTGRLDMLVMTSAPAAKVTPARVTPRASAPPMNSGVPPVGVRDRTPFARKEGVG